MDYKNLMANKYELDSPNADYNVRTDLASDHLLLQENELILNIWNRTDKDYAPCLAVHELFEEQVRRTPDQIAVIFGTEELTYRELNEKSNQLARYLRARYQQEMQSSELAPDTLIAVLLERSLTTVISLLAILKAGGAYLPLDLDYPDERIHYMLKDTQAKFILTQTHLRICLEKMQQYENAQYTFIFLDEINTFNNYLSSNLNIPLHTDALAYVNYTSGTTGKPKGVANTQQGLLNRIQWSVATYHLNSKDKLLQIAALGFDISVWEMLFPLAAGAQLVIASSAAQRNISYLRKIIFAQKITFLHIVPSLLNLLLDQPDFAQDNPLRQVLTGGEVVSPILRQQFMSMLPGKLYIAYGPTEAAISVTHLDCTNDKSAKINTIGCAIANTRLYVLDSILKPVPIGVIGELYIGGANLARGYLNQPKLTRERFIPNPFATEIDKAKGYNRLYKTGDLVRWLPDGNLEFIGRADQQIKLHGYRIELEEIENVIKTQPDILDCVVMVKTINNSEYLIAYFTLQQKYSSSIYDLTHLRRRLNSMLPSYMVPAYLIKMAELPLTVHGKIDRKNLPMPTPTDRFAVMV